MRTDEHEEISANTVDLIGDFAELHPQEKYATD
jgi:hypothetical protein